MAKFQFVGAGLSRDSIVLSRRKAAPSIINVFISTIVLPQLHHSL